MRTRCFGDLPCESQAYTQVEVVSANIPPEGLGNTLWAHRSGADAIFWWPPLSGSTIAGYRIYKDSEATVPKTTRTLAATVDSLTQTATDVGAVTSPPTPLACYQAVAFSCGGDLESPY